MPRAGADIRRGFEGCKTNVRARLGQFVRSGICCTSAMEAVSSLAAETFRPRGRPLWRRCARCSPGKREGHGTPTGEIFPQGRLPMRPGALRARGPSSRDLCLPLPGVPEAIVLGLRDLRDGPKRRCPARLGPARALDPHDRFRRELSPASSARPADRASGTGTGSRRTRSASRAAPSTSRST